MFSDLANKLDINSEALLLSDALSLEMKKKINSVRYEYMNEIFQTRDLVRNNLDKLVIKSIERIQTFDYETLNRILNKSIQLI